MIRLIMISLLISICTCFQIATANPSLHTHRVVGYYGNFYSHKMGVLGEYPPEQMLSMLNKEVDRWKAADPNTPVVPAIEYIAVVAQGQPGADGRYIARMPDAQIQHAISLANKINGIAILDIQVGLSNVQTEVPHFASYLALPNVTIGLDPEFAMSSTGATPGKKIGTLSAKDINYVINYMAEIIRKNNLPPKILVIHRFTEHMVTDYKSIKLVPEVQVVMDMDGWGPKSLKMDSYHAYISHEPVQFAGIKLFYKNDLKKPSTGLLTPEQILKLNPVPKFILFQ